MRKATTPAKVCDKCGSVLKHEEYDSFCDYCTMKIPKDIYYRIDIFWKSGHECNDHAEFCSLKCVRKFLLNFPYNKEDIDFISLPYIHDLDKLQTLLNDE